MTPRKAAFRLETIREHIASFAATTLAEVEKSRDPFRLLIACIISLRTKDQVTAEASDRLFARAPDAESILLGFAPGKSYLATGIARHGNFLQWGWSGPPSKMTPAGQALFINSLCYIQTFDGQAPVDYR